MSHFFHLVCVGGVEGVARELRLLALEERSLSGQSLSEAALKTRNDKKIHLKLAEQYLKTQVAQVQIDYSSPQFFKAVSQWLFEHAEENVLVQRLALEAWVQYLDGMLPEDFLHEKIIALGSHFFEAPYQLSGFLVWLLGHNVTPEAIGSSKLLQHYFEVESVVAMDDLKLVYSLMPDIDSVRNLKEYFLRVPASMPAFLNHPSMNMMQDNQFKFSSYNVMGERYYHHDKLDISPRESHLDHHLYVDDIIMRYASPLFELFNWALIRSLDLSNPMASIAFKKILSAHFESIVTQLPALSLTNEISYKQSEAILNKLAEYFMPENFQTVVSLVEKDVFYLHLYILVCSENYFIDDDRLCQFIDNMLCDPKYFDPRHILFLSTLSKFIDKNVLLHELSIRLKKALFNVVLEHDNIIDTDVLDEVISLEGISEIAAEKLDSYKSQLFEYINEFLLGHIDYYSVVTEWESKQKHVNVLVEINESLKIKTNYPFTTYALKALLLERSWGNHDVSDAPFDVDHVLELLDISHDEDDGRKKKTNMRVVQESLLYVKDPGLTRSLMQWAANNNYDDMSFYQMPFGDDDCLAEKAVAHSNQVLFEELVPRIQWSENLLLRVCVDILQTKNFLYATFLPPISICDCFDSLFEEFYVDGIDIEATGYDVKDVGRLFSAFCRLPEVGGFLIREIKKFSLIVERASNFQDESTINALFVCILTLRTLPKFKRFFHVLKAHVPSKVLRAIVSQEIDKATRGTISNYLAHYLLVQDKNAEKDSNDSVESDSDAERLVAKEDEVTDRLEDDDDDLAILLGKDVHSFNVGNQNTEVVMRLEDVHAEVAGTDEMQSSMVSPAGASFSYASFHELSQNEHSRFAQNSDRVAYLVERMSERRAGVTTLQQYPTEVFMKPEDFVAQGDRAPEVVAVSKIVPVRLPNGKVAVQAEAAGEKMHARRRYCASISVGANAPEDFTIYPLSPLGNAPPFFGPMPLRKKFSDSAMGARAAAQAKSVRVTKQGDPIIAVPGDFKPRSEQVRFPTQEGVMEKKGIQIYQECHDALNGALHPELLGILHQSANVMHLQTLRAKERRGEEVNESVRKSVFRDKFFRTELLHRHTFGGHRVLAHLFIYKGFVYRYQSKNPDKHLDLSKMKSEEADIKARVDEIMASDKGNIRHPLRLEDDDPLYGHPDVLKYTQAPDFFSQLIIIEDPLYIHPQRKSNLGAGRACHNTEMMIIERVYKWFALNVAKSHNVLDCQFDMFLDTEVIEYIRLVVMISFNDISIRVTHEIDALEKDPQFVKPSDLAGLVGTLVQLANAVVPAVTERVKILPNLTALNGPRTTLFQPAKRERSDSGVQVCQQDRLQPKANEAQFAA